MEFNTYHKKDAVRALQITEEFYNKIITEGEDRESYDGFDREYYKELNLRKFKFIVYECAYNSRYSKYVEVHIGCYTHTATIGDYLVIDGEYIDVVKKDKFESIYSEGL